MALIVTNGQGEPYAVLTPFKLTAAGWVSSEFAVMAGGYPFIVFDSSNAADNCPRACDSAALAHQFPA